MDSVLHVPAFQDNYIWLVAAGTSDPVIIVDPGDAAPVLHALDQRGLASAAIFCTHHHWDHTGGNAELRSRYDIPIYGPATERIPGMSHGLREGDRVAPAGVNLEFEVLDVPGHTAGHIAYYGHGMLFCGDTLFSAGCGRLFEGTPRQMHDSLAKLANLPDDTAVFCAHEYTLSNMKFALQVEPENAALQDRMTEVQTRRREGAPSLPSTIAMEKRTNPFLRCAEPNLRRAAEAHAGTALESSVEVFAELRRWKDGFRS